MAELDLEDDNVRKMAHRNHRPTETWTVDGTLVGVTCEMCNHDWPCPTKRSLVEHFTEALRRSEEIYGRPVRDQL